MGGATTLRMSFQPRRPTLEISWLNLPRFASPTIPRTPLVNRSLRWCSESSPWPSSRPISAARRSSSCRACPANLDALDSSVPHWPQALDGAALSVAVAAVPGVLSPARVCASGASAAAAGCAGEAGFGAGSARFSGDTRFCGSRGIAGGSGVRGDGEYRRRCTRPSRSSRTLCASAGGVYDGVPCVRMLGVLSVGVVVVAGAWMSMLRSASSSSTFCLRRELVAVRASGPLMVV